MGVLCGCYVMLTAMSESDSNELAVTIVDRAP